MHSDAECRTNASRAAQEKQRLGGLQAQRGQQQSGDGGAMRGGGSWQTPLGGEGGMGGAESREVGGSTGSSWGADSDIVAPLVSV